jgi:protein-L-isoaspartate(D-aspartate) O-methyltransferase
MSRVVIAAALFLLAAPIASAQYDEPFQAGETPEQVQQRKDMVKWLGESVKGIGARTLSAFEAVPRHKFMKKKDQKIAYENKWAGIGYGQTITNPWMVAYMTHLLDIKETDRVLEIGTGSGYQSSILGQLSPNTHTVEVIRPLGERSKAIQDQLGYNTRINHKIGDGYFGWEEKGPFDKIMVTCAADHIPVPLIQQLKPGGLMLIPVGPHFQKGNIYLVTKQEDGSIKRKVVATGTFVPLRRTDISEKKKD